MFFVPDPSTQSSKSPGTTPEPTARGQGGREAGKGEGSPSASRRKRNGSLPLGEGQEGGKEGARCSHGAINCRTREGGTG